MCVCVRVWCFGGCCSADVHIFLCWEAYVRFFSLPVCVCVCNQVCLCATVFCAIPELLLSLTWDYYSVSDLLLPFISIFSPCFIIFFYSAIFLMNTYMIFPPSAPLQPPFFCFSIIIIPPSYLSPRASLVILSVRPYPSNPWTLLRLQQ